VYFIWMENWPQLFILRRALLAWLGMEEVPGLETDGYLEAMLQQVPSVYYGGLFLSLAAVVAAWFLTHKQEDVLKNIKDEKLLVNKQREIDHDKKTDEIQLENFNNFEISPDDECEFIPLLSPEEDARVAEEMAPRTQYVPLDTENPTIQVQNFLRRRRGEDVEDELCSYPEDIGKYIKPQDLNVLEDPRESPSRKGSVMSRVKKARQRALRNAVERDMTADDRMKEAMAANQMLSRVYTVMRENKELFGETSFDDVKSQMDLYKA